MDHIAKFVGTGDWVEITVHKNLAEFVVVRTFKAGDEAFPWRWKHATIEAAMSNFYLLVGLELNALGGDIKTESIVYLPSV